MNKSKDEAATPQPPPPNAQAHINMSPAEKLKIRKEVFEQRARNYFSEVFYHYLN